MIRADQSTRTHPIWTMRILNVERRWDTWSLLSRTVEEEESNVRIEGVPTSPVPYLEEESGDCEIGFSSTVARW